jgi:hypothetical protein
MSLPTEEGFKNIQEGLKQKSDALIPNRVCSLCGSPI